MLAANQLAREACGCIAIEHAGEHIERIGFPIFLRIDQLGRAPRHHQIRLLGGRFHRETAYARLRRLVLRLARGQHARLEHTKVALGQLEHFLRRHIAHHHQRGIVGAVPFFVKLARILRGHVFQIIHPAHGGDAIRMRAQRGRHQLLVEQRARTVVSTHAALLHHHFDLFGEFSGRDQRIDHAVSLQLQH